MVQLEEWGDMMDRLLTDEEHRHLLVQYGAEIDWPEQIAQAQDAKGIRVDRQAMYAWWHDRCRDATHNSTQAGVGQARWICKDCIAEAIMAMAKGKAPWETD